MNYSYVMGIDNVDELKKKGFTITKIGNSYGVSFSDDNSKTFEDFICKNLLNGYWNEYLGKEKVFIFKFENGSIKKYILDSSNYDEILNLCRKFAEYDFESIEKMLKDNEFYYEKYFKEKR